MSLPDKVIILGKVEDEGADTFDLLYFIRNDEPYIPLFSTWAEFERQTAGTDYAHQGIEIDTRLLGAVLQSEYPMILNPLSPEMRLVDKSELLGIT